MSLQTLMIQTALARPEVRQVLEWAAAHVRSAGIPETERRMTAAEAAALQLLQDAGALTAGEWARLSTTETAPTTAARAPAG